MKMRFSTFSVFVVCGLLCVCWTQSTNSHNVDDSPCSMRSGAPGICKQSIEHCDDLWTLQEEGITKCGTPGSNMICCPVPENGAVNNPCTSQSGTAGVCKSIHDCDNIYELAKEDNPTSCGTGAQGNKLVCCPNKTSISSQKCKEYIKKKCINRKPKLEATSIIYNGIKVQNVEEFPHMALLGYDTGRGVVWYCGGTLISEQFVLTAAHCLEYNRATVSLVNLGFLHRNNRSVGTLQEFRVIDIVRHPERKVQFWYNDAMLLKLDRPVKLTNTVFPACLHEDTNIPSREIRAVGWGLNEDEELSEEMRKANLILVSNDECNTEYALQRRLPDGILEESQFCAGTNNKDTCQGDSGGPAVIRHSNSCINSIVGITSSGKDCSSNHGTSPTIFTRVSYYIPWIESVVWPGQ